MQNQLYTQVRMQDRKKGGSSAPISPRFSEPTTLPSVPFVGRVYGEIAFYLAILGLLIGIVGSAIALSGYSTMNTRKMIRELWQGKNIEQVWGGAGEISVPKNGYWFTDFLPKGDAVAELGITVIAMAAIGGMMGVAVVLFTKKDYLYLVFTLVVFLIMMSTMTGILRVR